MSIVDRVKNICLSPQTEWPVIAAEPASAGGLVTGYAIPLIAIGAVAGLIGGSIVGINLGAFGGTVRTPITTGIVAMCFTVVVGIISLFILSFIINALAPTFGGQQDSTQAMKVAVYAYTPAWVAGVLNIIPALGVLGIIAGLYSLYILYLGLPVLMKSPPEKAVGYTVVVVVCAIVLSVVLTSVVAFAGFGAMGARGLTSGMFGGGTASSASNDVQFDKNSPLGKLQELGQAMEKSNKELEAAKQSGDPNATAAAAMNSLGALLGGGRKVDSLDLEQLKSFVPDTFAGLTKQGNGSVEKNGLAGLMISKAESRYSSGEKHATLEIVDSGGASGLMGLASWTVMQSSKEDDNGSEKTTRVDGRLVHEERSKNGENEYAVVLGDRFMVTARSRDLNVEALKVAVSQLDLSRLESMKDAGVEKP